MAKRSQKQSDGKRVVVLGSGPGGYPAAFMAADRGYDVTLISEDQNPGGVCLYRGCIPSKTLLNAAKLIHEAKAAADMGIDYGEPKIDVDKLAKFSGKVVRKLTGGLGALAKQRKVTFVQGRGSFIDAHTIEVEKAQGAKQQLKFDHGILATGSRPTQIPGFPHDSDRVMDSTEALKLADVPKRLLVIGGGYIGLEMATVYAALGSEVTIVEALGRILAAADEDLVEHLETRLRKSVVKEILLDTKVTEVEALKTKCKVKLLGNDGEQQRDFDKVLVSVGRRPNSQDIGLDTTKIKTDQKGFVVIDHQRRTAEPHIFAIGDVAGEPMLAHKATYEARVAIEAMDGEPSAFDPAAIPAVVFTDPELAWCGLTEIEARQRGIDHHVARFPWAASGRATTLDRNDGLTKLVIDPHNQRLLGVGIVGVHAGELIAEGVLAVETGCLARDIQLSIHAHPTLSETVMEAAEMVHGSSPHYMARK